MEQHTAVKKMMCEMKLLENIPEEAYPYIRESLMRIWVVGWEHGRKELVTHHTRSVGQYTSDNILINTYPTINHAVKLTGFHRVSIWRAIVYERPDKQGWLWKYLPIILNDER